MGSEGERRERRERRGAKGAKGSEGSEGSEGERTSHLVKLSLPDILTRKAFTLIDKAVCKLYHTRSKQGHYPIA